MLDDMRDIENQQFSNDDISIHTNPDADYDVQELKAQMRQLNQTQVDSLVTNDNHPDLQSILN